MASERIMETDATRFNNFSSTVTAYSPFMKFGDANDTQSTPAILFGNTATQHATQRHAIRMPSYGTLRKIQVYYEAKTAGSDTGTVDFRLYDTPWGTGRNDIFDLVYEKRSIGFREIWTHTLPSEGIVFANRIAYQGNDPATNREATLSRNFLWLEIFPNDATVNAPIVWVRLFFTV